MSSKEHEPTLVKDPIYDPVPGRLADQRLGAVSLKEACFFFRI